MPSTLRLLIVGRNRTRGQLRPDFGADRAGAGSRHYRIARRYYAPFTPPDVSHAHRAGFQRPNGYVSGLPAICPLLSAFTARVVSYQR